jgi:hypothetical protein
MASPFFLYGGGDSSSWRNIFLVYVKSTELTNVRLLSYLVLSHRLTKFSIHLGFNTNHWTNILHWHTIQRFLKIRKIFHLLITDIVDELICLNCQNDIVVTQMERNDNFRLMVCDETRFFRLATGLIVKSKTNTAMHFYTVLYILYSIYLVLYVVLQFFVCLFVVFHETKTNNYEGKLFVFVTNSRVQFVVCTCHITRLHGQNILDLMVIVLLLLCCATYFVGKYHTVLSHKRIKLGKWNIVVNVRLINVQFEKIPLQLTENGSPNRFSCCLDRQIGCGVKNTQWT